MNGSKMLGGTSAVLRAAAASTPLDSARPRPVNLVRRDDIPADAARCGRKVQRAANAADTSAEMTMAVVHSANPGAAGQTATTMRVTRTAATVAAAADQVAFLSMHSATFRLTNNGPR